MSQRFRIASLITCTSAASQVRTQVAAEAVLQTLTPEQRHQVRAVAADMLPAYANAVAKQTPNAELVHDKFHVAKFLGEAVN